MSDRVRKNGGKFQNGFFFSFFLLIAGAKKSIGNDSIQRKA